MKLLINESPLQIIPSLALKVGLNEAILLQQLHFRALISSNIRDGHKWIYKTYAEWKNEEFPFWSVDTIKRTIRKLENSGYIVSTSSYNRMKMDKTKWYRIDYSKLQCETLQDASTTTAKSAEPEVQNASTTTAKTVEPEVQFAPSTEGNLPLAITKELKSNKNKHKHKHVENDLDVTSVIDYLNKKAEKQFNTSSKATERLVKARYREGYELKDFKKVIDLKVKDWLNNSQWHKYLRPSTLFNATNFENYLEETRNKKSAVSRTPKPIVLDFSIGED